MERRILNDRSGKNKSGSTTCGINYNCNSAQAKQSVASMFRCCTCKKELPDGDQGTLGSLPKIGLFTSGLFFGKMWVWPSKVCKDCVDCTARTGELGFCVAAAVVLLILIGIILGLSR